MKRNYNSGFVKESVDGAKPSTASQLLDISHLKDVAVTYLELAL